MEFELLSDAPLFAMDVLGSDVAAHPTGFGGPVEWASGITLSNITTILEDSTPSSRKRGFYECDDSDPTDSLSSSSVGSLSPPHSRRGSDVSSWGTETDNAFTPLSLLSTYSGTSAMSPSRPKRARSASFEAILKDFPDEGLGGSLGHAAAAPLQTSAWAPSAEEIPIFPPGADPMKARTPTGSPTAMTQPERAPSKIRSSLLESSEKPNFLKPLSAAERRRLMTAGHGAAIIRVNSDLSF
mmetsp:Transcript_34597/g.90604  ORF Transcript_34597/g.90604 Transcript_34597/m.90604 type:complete len:241 (+) Transcript_34597:135-857(+)|eukprot:CAMPEP_0182916628 /NCGR_PEP_ID=MMETSP0105_2-20130417/1063_1 /TAXON_ID=81532 ORGANISM="Acanthoeca-like sp., Strain 10tr" /NCGR_SAMPLE_ID=MMETSP0105_2 /ASSEMBLY_ACC=CAM_ASM_000205 /LENGTH=240 /DNA_ID=CAMNT_0025053593 /DNA_START=102 /DNA_END=824 /DNA_ORIENTATION=-